MTEVNDFNNTNVNLNKVIDNIYVCKCGCNLQFIDYKPGFDISIGNKWLITNNAMVKYKWSDYISINEFKLWKDFREDIILNYNETININLLNPQDAPWIHLYNQEVENKIPLNEKLYYEYVY